LYVPFCGLATIEQLSGIDTGVADPCLLEIQSYGQQALQPHQEEVVRKAEDTVARLALKCSERTRRDEGNVQKAPRLA